MIGVEEDSYDMFKQYWADFHLHLVSPHPPRFTQPMIILPESFPEAGTDEYVYPIQYYGDHWSTSKAEELLSSGLSMWKLYCTIEKIIALLVQSIETQGLSLEDEVQVTIAGYLSAKRKAFESIINLPHNVVVTNFDPDADNDWGRKYLQMVKALERRGYGLPASAPRDSYRKHRKRSTVSRRI